MTPAQSVDERFQRRVSVNQTAEAKGRRSYRIVGLVLRICLPLLIGGCGGDMGGPSPVGTALVSFVAAPPPIVSRLTITVTGPGIDTPLLFNLAIDTLTHLATGSFALPAGAGRQIVAEAFDSSGIATHRGAVTVSLVAGDNPTVSITMSALVGNVPIVVTFGNTVLVLVPRDTTVFAGDTVTFAFRGFDEAGVPIGEVAWGTGNPAIAGNLGSGAFVARVEGDVAISVSSGWMATTGILHVSSNGWSRFAINDRSTCGRSTSGHVYCWGHGDLGQLGADTVSESLEPVQVRGSPSVVNVSGRWQHVCALADSGDAYCWGFGTWGQLGDGRGGNSARPVLVTGGLTFSEVTTGFLHTCGLTIQGLAYCWGGNTDGQLGNGTFATSFVPVPVVGGHTFVHVSAGVRHTCGLDANGSVFCWGLGAVGALGNGDTLSSPVPVRVRTDSIFAMLSAGGFHTCALTQQGRAMCWGDNTYGSLGDSTTTTRLAPVHVAEGLSFMSLSGGYDYTCGIDVTARAYCWGDNGTDGKLGDGTHSNRAAPVLVVGGTLFSSIYAGYYHTCGVAVDDKAYCWGNNDYGQLGDGSTVESAIPQLIVSPPRPGLE